MSRAKFLTISIIVLSTLMASSSSLVLFCENNDSLTSQFKPITVACVGDSITQYCGYPEFLQNLLGGGHVVHNFGVSSTTVLTNSNTPYKGQPAYLYAKLWAPDFVIVMLGTNDAKAINYVNVENFNSDYSTLINGFQNLANKPKVLILVPPLVFDGHNVINATDLEQGIIPRIRQVALILKLPTIDFSLILNNQIYFPDGVHPNAEGAKIIASEVAKFIHQMKCH